MTELQHIELFLDASYAPDEQKGFIFGSRCICNYVERGLAAFRFQSPYSRLNIHCTRDRQAAGVRPLMNESFLEVFIKFEVRSLDSLAPEAVQQQFAQIILAGLKAANTYTPVPIEKCSQVLQQFKDAGFVNRWPHLDKYWKQWKCRCVVSAELTVEHFAADQLVYIDGELIATRRIAETKPREGLFVDNLGELSVSAQGIMNYKKKGKVLTVFDLQQRAFIDSPSARILFQSSSIGALNPRGQNGWICPCQGREIGCEGIMKASFPPGIRPRLRAR